MHQQLAKNIRKLLKKNNISTSFLARQTGIGQPVIHRIMSGETRNPKISTLLPIAQFFGLQIEQLISNQPLVSMPVMNTLPIVTLDQVNNHLTHPIEPNHTLTIDLHLSERAFCIINQDSAMCPLFPLQSALIFDPDFVDENCEFTLARVGKDHLFRKLSQSPNMNILSALDKRFPDIHMEPHDQLIAGLVQARLTYLSFDRIKGRSQHIESLPMP